MESPMTGSNFQTLLLPLLESLKDGEPHSVVDIKAELIRFIELTDRGVKWFDPEKEAHVFDEAISLAMEHLTRAGLIVNSEKDGMRISSLGKLVLNKRLNSIDIDFLRRLPGYIA
jgi:restriction system protein